MSLNCLPIFRNWFSFDEASEASSILIFQGKRTALFLRNLFVATCKAVLALSWSLYKARKLPPVLVKEKQLPKFNFQMLKKWQVILYEKKTKVPINKLFLNARFELNWFRFIWPVHHCYFKKERKLFNKLYNIVSRNQGSMFRLSLDLSRSIYRNSFDPSHISPFIHCGTLKKKIFEEWNESCYN